jgi:hypothetical protein
MSTKIRVLCQAIEIFSAKGILCYCHGTRNFEYHDRTSLRVWAIIYSPWMNCCNRLHRDHNYRAWCRKLSKDEIFKIFPAALFNVVTSRRSDWAINKSWINGRKMYRPGALQWDGLHFRNWPLAGQKLWFKIILTWIWKLIFFQLIRNAVSSVLTTVSLSFRK